jgi:O-antigen ligase
MQREATRSSQSQMLPSPPRAARHTSFALLAIAWLIAGAGAALPLTESTIFKGSLLLVPVALSLMVVLITPDEGFALWSICLGFLVSQTGFLLDIGSFRTSALEVVLVVLILALLWIRRRAVLHSGALAIPGRPILALFVLDALVMLGVGLMNGARPAEAVLVMKGFVFYPAMLFIMLVGMRNQVVIRWSVAVAVAWYVYYAVTGLVQFSGREPADILSTSFRVDGGYASINTFGVTLVAVSLLIVGIAITARARATRIMLVSIALLLFVGAVTSVSRTVWIAFAVGLLFFWVGGRSRSVVPLIGVILAVLLLLSLPGPVTGRILQLSDSSTARRTVYLTAALEGFRSNWLTGWGWGITYWSSPDGEGGVSAPGVPWFHNEYLNLGVQTGAIGLSLYFGFWISFVHATRRWLNHYGHSPLAGFVRGGQVALVSLFVSAAFEHVLWKPDIVGLVWWIAGITLAAMHVGQTEPRAFLHSADRINRARPVNGLRENGSTHSKTLPGLARPGGELSR